MEVGKRAVAEELGNIQDLIGNAIPGSEGRSVEDMEADLNCWICRDVVSASDTSCIKPCKCKGSMAIVHKDCLEEWLNTSDKRSCPACKFDYVLATEPRYPTFVATVSAWMKSVSLEEAIIAGFNGLLLILMAIMIVCMLLIWLNLAEVVAFEFFRCEPLFAAISIEVSWLWEIPKKTEVMDEAPQWNLILLLVSFTQNIVFCCTYFYDLCRGHWKTWRDWSLKMKVLPNPFSELEPQDLAISEHTRQDADEDRVQ